ncbi:MAG: BCD family MFS transporter [Leptolyngbyaceae bacterium]|nr:BCD family MFS transporter [Leptolyngbyaceae bacterium]
MAMGDISEPTFPPTEKLEASSKLNLLTMFRLGLFQMGLGMMSVLTLGVLNRVLIDELSVPALIAAGALAMHQFVAPARVWFGMMSDARPFLGHHRTGYVWTGAALFATAAFVAVQVIWQLGGSLQAFGWAPQTYAWAGLLALVFAGYGLALSGSSTPFAALLVDVSDEENRSKLVGIVWSMLMVGIVIGAIISSVLLKQLALDAPLAVLQASINRLFLIVPAVVLGLTVAATWGVERQYSCYASRSTVADREDSITLGRALKVLAASRQTGLFFAFLIVMTISLFMQEPVLEPYGGQVFGMKIAETTQLNAFWGIGTLLGMSTTGFLVVPRLGKQKTTKLGCFLVACSFMLIILSGFTQNQKLLQVTLILFGLASGITTTGAISLMLDLTAAETAGTFIGTWGLAQAIARGIATVTGGAVLDIGKQISSNLMLAYGLVFSLQAVGMLLAIGLLAKVDVQEFRNNARQAIATVLQGELD